MSCIKCNVEVEMGKKPVCTREVCTSLDHRHVGTNRKRIFEKRKFIIKRDTDITKNDDIVNTDASCIIHFPSSLIFILKSGILEEQRRSMLLIAHRKSK